MRVLIWSAICVQVSAFSVIKSIRPSSFLKISRGNVPEQLHTSQSTKIDEENELYPLVLSNVQFWKVWSPENSRLTPTIGSDSRPTKVSQGTLIRSLSNVLGGAASAVDKSLNSKASREERRYWRYHSSRLTFFTGQNAFALALARLRLRANQGFGEPSSKQHHQQPNEGGGADEPSTPASSTSLIFEANTPGPLLEGLGNLVTEAVAMWEQDYENIRAGLYKRPWDQDMGLSHRQADPRFVLDKAARLVDETYGILRRRLEARARKGEEAGRALLGDEQRQPTQRGQQPSKQRRVWLGAPPADGSLPSSSSSSSDSSDSAAIYPEYYLNDFHFQTDGWLSERSAKVYETATESLFLGRQDAMQRSALVPLSLWWATQQAAASTAAASPPKRASGAAQARGSSTSSSSASHSLFPDSPFEACKTATTKSSSSSSSGRGPKILEVGCGTGRLATFVRDNFPSSDLALLDLSPWYLEAARENMAYWETARGWPSVTAAETAAAAAPLGSVSFEQGKAESLPFPDASFDAVVCVYLFHELPPRVRAQAAAEASRVLRPGGVAVLVDSVQRGDRSPEFDARLERFPNLNEPFFASYADENLTGLFTSAGLKPMLKGVASVSKTLAFQKPADSN